MSDSLHILSVSFHHFLQCFHAGGVRALCAQLFVAIFISCSPIKCVCATIAIHSCFICTTVDRQPTLSFAFTYFLPYLRWRLMRGYPTVSRSPFVPSGRRRLLKSACCPPTPLLPDTGGRGLYGETGDLAGCLYGA